MTHPISSLCGRRHLCVVVIELCPAILSTVNAPEHGDSHVNAVWRKQYISKRPTLERRIVPAVRDSSGAVAIRSLPSPPAQTTMREPTGRT
jgi:hypothetical protein